jgi:DNA repair protein RecN (Recombination protein N)
MIKHLSVSNYALIEQLEIDFSKGLTIITGETGAGKSILLGALGLIMGKRAETKALFNEEEKCIVEAIFDIRPYKLRFFFEENDLDYREELLIRREILPNGKSRAFINDTPANLNLLTDLSSSLIDLHQQFDSLDIHKISFQLNMLDALAGNGALLEEYRTVYQKWQKDSKTLETYKAQQAKSEKEIEFLDFQLAELEAARLNAGEQTQLEEEMQVLSNSEEIKSALALAFNKISEGEISVSSMLTEIGNQLHPIARFDKNIADLVERFDSLKIELDDLSGAFESAAEDLEYNPGRLEEVRERLDLLYRLQKKHHVNDENELLEVFQKFSEDRQNIDQASAEIEVLEDAVRGSEKWLREVAEQLHTKRSAVIQGFEQAVMGRLGLMAMEHAVLQIEMTPLNQPGPSGMDEINFLFAANKGSRLQLIKDVASGGELSRLTLAIKSLVASAIPLPTLIFDEIDAGISGDVALKMGKILRELSDSHQVVTITHSPQVASKADVHYFVFKDPSGDKTSTRVKSLSPEDRIQELAIMLSQNPPSQAAIENAKELLNHK